VNDAPRKADRQALLKRMQALAHISNEVVAAAEAT